jgi:DNA polymerase-3 subunit epsilon
MVAIDLKGSGAQDRNHEAILEIALVPIVDRQPDVAGTYCTLVNPQRPIHRRPWISPASPTKPLRAAPTVATIERELARRINGKYLVGHNVGVDWRLLHRRCSTIIPAGLIDTLCLARKIDPKTQHGLGALLAFATQLLGEQPIPEALLDVAGIPSGESTAPATVQPSLFDPTA